MRHGTQGHVAAPRERLRGVKVAQTRGRTTQVHADAPVAPRGRESGWQEMGPRVSGQGRSIGAVTQRHYAALCYILTYPTNFLRVGLCSLLISSL